MVCSSARLGQFTMTSVDLSRFELSRAWTHRFTWICFAGFHFDSKLVLICNIFVSCLYQLNLMISNHPMVIHGPSVDVAWAGLEQGGSQVDPGRALGAEQRQRRSGALRRHRHCGLRGGGDDLGESDPTAGPLHQGSCAWDMERLSISEYEEECCISMYIMYYLSISRI